MPVDDAFAGPDVVTLFVSMTTAQLQTARAAYALDAAEMQGRTDVSEPQRQRSLGFAHGRIELIDMILADRAGGAR